ncbi:MAG: DUF3341 domain-containing protein [Myxococcaceae bacterium]
MSRKVLVGYFETEESILGATRAARDAGLAVHDVYTPYAVHGMEEALGLRASRLPWVCFVAGAAGLAMALGLQYYTSVVSWPLNVGGKPFNSLPAFIPVTFEVTVLVAGLVSVAAFFLRSWVLPGVPALALPRVTNDRFALALSTAEAGFDVEGAQTLLRRLGAVETGLAQVRR